MNAPYHIEPLRPFPAPRLGLGPARAWWGMICVHGAPGRWATIDVSPTADIDEIERAYAEAWERLAE